MTLVRWIMTIMMFCLAIAMWPMPKRSAASAPPGVG